MAAIPWTEFEKEELVELLEELEQCQFMTTQLWSECDVHYVPACSCAPSEERLPARVLEIRDQVVKRMKETDQAKQTAPSQRLLELLRRPFGTRGKRKRA